MKMKSSSISLNVRMYRDSFSKSGSLSSGNVRLTGNDEIVREEEREE
jgi:hypothetical protein